MSSVANTKDIERIISDKALSNGFTRKGPNWYYRTDDCICMMNLQKSEYGGKYYVNLGVFLTGMDNSIDFPKEHKCHVRVRLIRVVPDREPLEKSLDLEDTSIDSTFREAAIGDNIEKFAIPLLKKLSTLDNLKNHLMNENVKSWAILLATYQFLDIPVP